MIKAYDLIDACEHVLNSFRYPTNSDEYFTTVDGWQPELGFTDDFGSLVPFGGIHPPSSGFEPARDALSNEVYQLTFFIIDAWSSDTAADAESNIKTKCKILDALRDHIWRNIETALVSACRSGSTPLKVEPLMYELAGEPLVFEPKDEYMINGFWAAIFAFKAMLVSQTPRGNN